MSLSPQQRALRKRRSALKRSARLAARKRRNLDRNPQFSADSAAIQPLTLSALERRLPASETPPETIPVAGLVPAPQAGSPPSREAFYRSLPPHVRQRMVEMALAKIEEIQRRSQLSTAREDAEDGDQDELDDPGDVSVAEEFMDAEFDDEESQHQECDAQSFAESSGRPQTASPPVTAGAPASPTVLESGGATAQNFRCCWSPLPTRPRPSRVCPPGVCDLFIPCRRSPPRQILTGSGPADCGGVRSPCWPERVFRASRFSPAISRLDSPPVSRSRMPPPRLPHPRPSRSCSLSAWR